MTGTEWVKLMWALFVCVCIIYTVTSCMGG
jgi:hypothetical protein